MHISVTSMTNSRKRSVLLRRRPAGVRTALCCAWALAIVAGVGPIPTPSRGQIGHERLRQGGASGDQEAVLAAQETDVSQGVARPPEHRAVTTGTALRRQGGWGRIHRTAPSPMWVAGRARRAR